MSTDEYIFRRDYATTQIRNPFPKASKILMYMVPV